MNKITNIIYSGNRLFFNITKSGCGSNCFYCYVNDSARLQNYYSKQYIEKSINYLLKDSNFIKGRNGTLVSFCPSTEPFKTVVSSFLISLPIKNIMPHGNPIQISTKEAIPTSILQLINDNMTYDGQVVLFISISSISKAQIFEPHASPISLRFSNFDICRLRNIRTCLYIKPFLQDIVEDRIQLFDLLNHFHPDAFCIGIYYKKHTNSNAPYRHPVHKSYYSKGVSQNLSEFRLSLAENFPGIPIFLNSTCVSSYFANRTPPRQIWIEDPNLCIKCRDCTKIGSDL